MQHMPAISSVNVLRLQLLGIRALKLSSYLWLAVTGNWPYGKWQFVCDSYGHPLQANSEEELAVLVLENLHNG
jgi:hypothetical protein